MEMILEYIVYIIAGILSAIATAIVTVINRKRVRNRMETLDYMEQKQKRKSSYTRNLMLNDQIVSKIKEEDPNFDELEFKKWSKETFLEFQKAWSNKNFSSIRNRLDNNLCEHYDILSKNNIDENSVNIIDIKQINYVDLSSYSRDNEKELLEVAINVVLHDYIMNKESNKITNGNKTVKIRTTYKLIFYRKLGTQTTENDITKTIKCPNCGAKVKMGENKCEYCNSLILNGVKEWILNNIDKY